MVALDDLTEAAPTDGQDWNAAGVVLAPGLLDDRALEPYEQEWVDAHGEPPQANMGGWASCTPYEDHPALLRLCCDLRIANLLQGITGEPMAVHLNLTPWVSTERDWHQDQYLNPPAVGDRYAAVWIALQDVHPDSGPFQYVPGSHRWPQVSQAKLLAQLRPQERDDPAWPKYSERILTPLFEDQLARSGAMVETYLPKRGDVLVWHARLLHRGSKARVPGLERRALIAHYSALDREDMPRAVQYLDEGWYFSWR